MNSFILIVWTYSSIFHYGMITSIGGFASPQACDNAGKALVLKDNSFSFVCVQANK